MTNTPSDKQVAEAKEMKLIQILTSHNLPVNFTARRCCEAGASHARQEIWEAMKDCPGHSYEIFQLSDLKAIIFGADPCQKK